MTTAQLSLRQSAEQRSDRRYPLEIELEYRLISHRLEIAGGRGFAINLSSSGLLFRSDYTLRPGIKIELSLLWPARLDNTMRLKLWLTGYTVRTQENLTAVKITSYQFRTAGTLQRPSIPKEVDPAPTKPLNVIRRLKG